MPDSDPTTTDLILSAALAKPATGARVAFNADWSMDTYNAVGEVTFHVDAPLPESIHPPCDKCEICAEGQAH